MSLQQKPKWEIGVACDKGNQSIALAEKYSTEIEPRLQPDELTQHKANVIELGVRRAGQKENITEQKSTTLGQNQAIGILHDTAISIRNIVKSCNASPEILKAYGVGEKVNKNVTSVLAAGNTIIKGYNKHTDWSKNQAGILEEDITQISNLVTMLSEADSSQETTKFVRKSKTMDKNILHRTVEEEITKISAIGNHVFLTKNPSVARLFANLIPTSSKLSETVEEQPTTETKS